MTDLDAPDPAAKPDDMVDPAFLAASMIDERAPDIVEALNDVPAELAAGVLLRLPSDLAIEVLDQPGLDREPELITLMPRDAAAKLLAGVSADRVADKTRVNDCGWFVPRPEAYRGGGAVMAQPGRSALDALFSNASGTNPPADGEPDKPASPASLDDLFRK